MSLAPLLNASPVIQLHAFAALAALGLGVVQLVGVKGSRAHKVLGWGWVVLMSATALSSWGITVHNGQGRYSFIHGFSALVMVLLPLAIWAIWRGKVRMHRRLMLGMFFGGLVITGALTLLPGRIMHQVVFG